MTRRSEPRNVPASVRARLQNLARSREVDFNLLLDCYAAERFLYRFSASSEVDRFTLKGAALFRRPSANDRLRSATNGPRRSSLPTTRMRCERSGGVHWVGRSG